MAHSARKQDFADQHVKLTKMRLISSRRMELSNSFTPSATGEWIQLVAGVDAKGLGRGTEAKRPSRHR